MDLHIGLSLYVRPLTDVPNDQVSASIAETTIISDQPSVLHRAGILLARFILLQDALAVARRVGQVVSDTISLQSNWAASFRYNSAQFEGIDIGDTPVVALVVSHEEQTSVGDQVETGQLSNVQLSDGSTIQDQIQVTPRFKSTIQRVVTLASNVTVTVLHKTSDVMPLTVHDEVIVEVPVPAHVQKQIDKLLERIATETNPKKLAKLQDRLDKLYAKYGL